MHVLKDMHITVGVFSRHSEDKFTRQWLQSGVAVTMLVVLIRVRQHSGLSFFFFVAVAGVYLCLHA